MMSDDHRPSLTTSSPRWPHFTIPATYCGLPSAEDTINNFLDSVFYSGLIRNYLQSTGDYIVICLQETVSDFLPFEVFKKFDLSISAIT